LSEDHRTRFARQVNRGAFAVLATALLMAPAARAGTKYKVLHAFGRGNDGGGVYASVTLDGQGNLYGTTTGGGSHNSGTVFELTPMGGGRWAEKILHSFCSLPRCVDGGLLWAGLVVDAAGKLYGASTTVVFELSPTLDSADGWSFHLLLSHAGSGSSLVLDKVGDLYGPIGPGKYGGGAVTEASAGSDGWTDTYLYSFCPKFGCLDGDEPSTVLTRDAKGNLYGATLRGGRGKAGVAFELEHTANGWKEHVLHNFPAHSGDGYPPSSGLTLDSVGNLYGTTLQGGSKRCEGGGCGTVFQLMRGTDVRWKETILYNFPTLKDGAGPGGGLAIDMAGNLYGTSGGNRSVRGRRLRRGVQGDAS
jgi:uncharacterized repeat protein (TIGR03803 family)